MADIRVRPVAGRRDFSTFLSVPSLLHRDDPHHVEPLGFERRQHLGPNNPYFRHARHCYFLAEEDGQPCGRISAQIDALAQQEGEPALGHFGLIEARDEAVLHALLKAAENWLRDHGALRVAGPYSLSVNDECGLLVDGFDSPPRMLMNYSPRWMGQAIEAAGYAKAKDLYAYTLDAGKPIPRLAQTMAERAATLPGVRERPMDPRHFDRELGTVLALFNAAWRDNWGFVAMTPEEIALTAKNLKPVIVPSLVRLVEVEGVPAGMVVYLPDVNRALAGLNGRLLPFGWLKLLWRLKVRPVDSGRVLLMGVDPAYRDGVTGAALAVLLIARLYAEVSRRGGRDVEMSWILEDNEPVKRVIEMFGGRHYKTYRIYDKPL